MAGNTIMELTRLGQSVWIDNLSRELVESGELERLIKEVGITGVTSNPTIFQKAVSGKDDYDESMGRLLGLNLSDPKELFFQLAFEDVGAAADLLRRNYEESRGHHGFVSIEVAPDLAYDTETTISEVRWIFSSLGRKNVMVKVPATREGLPAIEQLTADGVNVNVTLLFSVKRYAEVVDAYMKGIERRISQNHAVGEIASVASFFVSRVDTLVDKLLEEKIQGASSDAERKKLNDLKGKAAVANARLAYEKGEEIRNSGRFKALAEKGANWQRLLWGSTSTKDPAYSDIKYVQELIGPDTVNTMPPETIEAYLDHGDPRVTIRDDGGMAEALFEELRSVGIDIDDVTGELEKDGVKKFADSYFALLDEISRKRDKLTV
ncbi:MAG: transaldolase [Nitrospirota bacterium]|jgi:transaldolase